MNCYFNPRSLAGATLTFFFLFCPGLLFQSTLPRGSDPIFGCSYLCYFVFQSTLPRGSDPIIRNSERFAGIISIHAPSRERLTSPYVAMQACVFQSTLPRGSDELAKAAPEIFDNFNPRSLAGATIKGLLTDADGKISIHAPSRERLSFSVPLVKLRIISIHAPSRERP